MSDVAELKVVIGATVDGAVKGLNDVSKGLATTAIAAQKVDSSFQKFSKSTTSATQAMTNLGRIVQDAPFGFLGISNNLNPMLESFQRLKAETGSTGGALKALGSSLIGAGGLGFAISIVSSLLVVFGDKIFGTGTAAKAASDKNKDYADSIKSIDEAVNTSIGNEVGHLQVLLSVARDAGAATEIRTNAVNELQKLYPSYLANLSDEQIKTGDITAATNLLTKALIAKAFAEASEKKFQATSTQILDLTEDRTKAVGALVTAQAAFNDELKAPLTVAPGTLFALDELKAGSTLDKAKSALTSINGQLNEARLNQANYLVQTQKYAEEAGDLFIKPVKPLKEVADKADKAAKKVKELKDQFLNLGDLKGIAGNPVSPFLKPFEIKFILDLPETEFEIAKRNARRKAAELAKVVSDTINENLKNALSAGVASLGESIGNVLSGVQNPFAGFLTVIGNSIKSLGDQMIQLGIEALIIKKALATFNPALLIIGGAALEAIGTVLLSQGIHPHAGGGVVPPGFPNDTYLAALTSGERIIPAGQSASFAGSGAQIIVLETRVSGSDLVILQNRATNSRGRKY